MQPSGNNIILGLVILGLAALLAVLLTLPEPGPPAFREVTMDRKDHEYSTFASCVIGSREELAELVKRVENRCDKWSDRREKYRPPFIRQLRAANVDFQRECLVLLRLTEGSGSVEVTFDRPYVRSRTLVCNFRRNVPDCCTLDMAYYCVALSVDRARVDAVELRADGKRITLLPVPAR